MPRTATGLDKADDSIIQPIFVKMHNLMVVFAFANGFL